MYPKVCWSPGPEGCSGAPGTAVQGSALLPCLMLAALAAVMACSASGTPFPGAPTAAVTSAPAPPTAAVQQPPQDVIVKRICEQQTADVSVNKCGDFYSTYPTGFVVDAATEIFDKSGEHIDSCGGYRFFSSEEAREESERKCSTYLTGCTQVAESCSSKSEK